MTATASLPRRLTIAAAAVFGVVLVPAALVGLVAGPVAAAAFPFGAIGGVLAATGDGRGAAVRMLPLVAVGGASAAATAGGWGWVAVLAVLGGLVGWLTTMGRPAAITEVAIVIASAAATSGWRNALLYGAFSALGYLFGVLVARLAGADETVPRAPLNYVHPWRAALLGAAALAAAGLAGLHAQWVKPFWIPVSFLVLLQFRLTSEDNGWRPIVLRVIGTYLGVLLLVPVVARLAPAPQAVSVVLLLITGLALATTVFWLSVVLITAAVVLAADGAGVDLAAVGEQRFGAVAIGLGLLLAVVAALRWVRRVP